ncbi:uncharacterized protein LOC101848851 [Aplysia californica]|uniref:NAD(+) kinase n=1 Tax=Aplysia californica TaxID=6500 RepID=A0ABM1AC56_APLCA|nr:uncharacterized protein LOC101848851 [Aplysia californica]
MLAMWRSGQIGTGFAPLRPDPHPMDTCSQSLTNSRGRQGASLCPLDTANNNDITAGDELEGHCGGAWCCQHCRRVHSNGVHINSVHSSGIHSNGIHSNGAAAGRPGVVGGDFPSSDNPSTLSREDCCDVTLSSVNGRAESSHGSSCDVTDGVQRFLDKDSECVHDVSGLSSVSDPSHAGNGLFSQSHSVSARPDDSEALDSPTGTGNSPLDTGNSIIGTGDSSFNCLAVNGAENKESSCAGDGSCSSGFPDSLVDDSSTIRYVESCGGARIPDNSNYHNNSNSNSYNDNDNDNDDDEVRVGDSQVRPSLRRAVSVVDSSRSSVVTSCVQTSPDVRSRDSRAVTRRASFPRALPTIAEAGLCRCERCVAGDLCCAAAAAATAAGAVVDGGGGGCGREPRLVDVGAATRRKQSLPSLTSSSSTSSSSSSSSPISSSSTFSSSSSSPSSSSCSACSASFSSLPSPFSASPSTSSFAASSSSSFSVLPSETTPTSPSNRDLKEENSHIVDNDSTQLCQSRVVDDDGGGCDDDGGDDNDDSGLQVGCESKPKGDTCQCKHKDLPTSNVSELSSNNKCLMTPPTPSPSPAHLLCHGDLPNHVTPDHAMSACSHNATSADAQTVSASDAMLSEDDSRPAPTCDSRPAPACDSRSAPTYDCCPAPPPSSAPSLNHASSPPRPQRSRDLELTQLSCADHPEGRVLSGRGGAGRRASHGDLVWLRHVKSFSCNYMTIPDPSNQRLNWTKPPLSVLIIRKHLDESVLSPFRDLVVWLVEEKQMLVYVEQSVLEEPQLAGDADFAQVQDRLTPFTEGVDDLTDKVDFIICLGGDGTLLYASSLFQGSVPPVMAFNMGSLGFLTPFQFYEDFKMEVNRVMKGSASLLLRYRLKCVVVRHDPNHDDENIPHVKNIQKEHGSLKTHKLVLNEVVVDRGPSSYLSNLDLYIEGRRVTSVQGDGLIISTPTGSTAYAVAAGASMIHPSVPCILLTPICPHSLSFRPIVVPAGVEIKVMLSPEARGTAMVSFDGRDRQEMHQGDSLRITTAAYPVPSICAVDQIEDWFDGLAVCLNWNIRRQQRPLMSTSSLTSIDSADSDAMTSSQHSQLNGQSDKSSSRSLTGGNGS